MHLFPLSLKAVSRLMVSYLINEDVQDCENNHFQIAIVILLIISFSLQNEDFKKFLIMGLSRPSAAAG